MEEWCIGREIVYLQSLFFDKWIKKWSKCENYRIPLLLFCDESDIFRLEFCDEGERQYSITSNNGTR